MEIPLTNSQKLRAKIIEGKARFLHVSVAVGCGDITDEHGLVHRNVPMRTPPGKGATARKNPEIEKLLRVGKHRRAMIRALRAQANEEGVI